MACLPISAFIFVNILYCVRKALFISLMNPPPMTQSRGQLVSLRPKLGVKDFFFPRKKLRKQENMFTETRKVSFRQIKNKMGYSTEPPFPHHLKKPCDCTVLAGNKVFFL